MQKIHTVISDKPVNIYSLDIIWAVTLVCFETVKEVVGLASADH